jgi:lipopolysaccharide transport system ATP-binding protein
VALGDVDSERLVTLVLDRLDLVPGDYFVDVGVYEGDWRYAYDFHWHVYPLTVLGDSSDGGVFRPPHRWRIASGGGTVG